MDAFQILVVVLSVFLALFLLLAIILAAMLIRVSKQIRRVTSSAQHTVEKIEGIATNVNAITSVGVMSRVVRRFIKEFKK